MSLKVISFFMGSLTLFMSLSQGMKGDDVFSPDDSGIDTPPTKPLKRSKPISFLEACALRNAGSFCNRWSERMVASQGHDAKCQTFGSILGEARQEVLFIIQNKEERERDAPLRFLLSAEENWGPQSEADAFSRTYLYPESRLLALQQEAAAASSDVQDPSLSQIDSLINNFSQIPEDRLVQWTESALHDLWGILYNVSHERLRREEIVRQNLEEADPARDDPLFDPPSLDKKIFHQ